MLRAWPQLAGRPSPRANQQAVWLLLPTDLGAGDAILGDHGHEAAGGVAAGAGHPARQERGQLGQRGPAASTDSCVLSWVSTI